MKEKAGVMKPPMTPNTKPSIYMFLMRDETCTCTVPVLKAGHPGVPSYMYIHVHVHVCLFVRDMVGWVILFLSYFFKLVCYAHVFQCTLYAFACTCTCTCTLYAFAGTCTCTCI